MRVKKLTPVLFVDAIEPCLDFWTTIGFEKAGEVPEGERIGFLILKKDDVEVMYQTRTLVAADIPALKDAPAKGTFIYIEVDDVDSVDRLVAGADHVMPRRKTFYGSDEVLVREPGGNVVVFAQFG